MFQPTEVTIMNGLLAEFQLNVRSSPDDPNLPQSVVNLDLLPMPDPQMTSPAPLRAGTSLAVEWKKNKNASFCSAAVT